jgi:hypothetical protein
MTWFISKPTSAEDSDTPQRLGLLVSNPGGVGCWAA